MSKQRTLSIIKPDATARNVVGKILAKYEEKGLKIVAAKMMHLSPEQGGEFYAVHKARPFFGELVDYISSGPVMVSVLEGDNAVLLHRDIMGATDPKKAAPGTVRADFGVSLSANAVHGSDAPETAAQEIKFFFPDLK